LKKGNVVYISVQKTSTLASSRKVLAAFAADLAVHPAQDDQLIAVIEACAVCLQLRLPPESDWQPVEQGVAQSAA